jgi:hypothetical protein
MPATAQHRPPLLTAGPQRQASCSTMLGSLSKGQRSGSRAVTCFLSDTGVDEAFRRAGFSGHPRFGGLPAWWPVVLAGASRRPSRPRDFQSRGLGCRVPWRRSSRSPSLVACLPTSGRDVCMTHWAASQAPARRVRTSVDASHRAANSGPIHGYPAASTPVMKSTHAAALADKLRTRGPEESKRRFPDLSENRL